MIKVLIHRVIGMREEKDGHYSRSADQAPGPTSPVRLLLGGKESPHVPLFVADLNSNCGEEGVSRG
jgi:hypothetical protein